MSLAAPITVADGTKISAPGVYAMSMAAYHGDCCVAPSISSSGLRTIWSQSPAHYFHTSPYNLTPPEPEERPHFSIGRAAHHLIYLGRKGFDEEFVVRPSEWSDWRSKPARIWRDEMRLAGKTIITDGELENITGMARALGAHPLVKQGLLDGHVERSLIWQDRETGVWLKARPDNVPGDGSMFADLKTTDSVSDEALERSLASYGYHMQAALVGMASEAVLGRPMEEFALVWVEKKAPWCVRVSTLVPADIERGRMQLRRAIRDFARCVETGRWPGPGGDRSDAAYLSLPTWAATRIDRALEYAAAEAANENHETGAAA